MHNFLVHKEFRALHYSSFGILFGKIETSFESVKDKNYQN